MKRIHLFEFEDQKWFPSILRKYMTDFLQFLANKMKIYASVVDLIHETMQKAGTSNIIDLGSGSGGGLLHLSEELKAKNPNLNITLTDYYPNIQAFEAISKKNSQFNYSTKSVDARNVPSELKGLRTQFLSFHHFRPEDAKKILENAIEAKQAIALFEVQDRSIPSLIVMFFSPISVLLTAPFIKPFTFTRILFTYIIPILPLTILWDGIISCLRTYSVTELQKLVSSIENHSQFEWQIEKRKAKGGFVLVLVGIVKERS